ncbi:MFS siderochrome iron transporter C [Pseudocercospora fuligena]|uniref:MFS siderochrome iron transporter C n=1 Tax=Pseudocercospora fuligena TaxID=685502 RepID=A0A8H6R6D9_9PEZI|nr:MFS siderochrome iron transporter C [Pseudocercospora fuligena]
MYTAAILRNADASFPLLAQDETDQAERESDKQSPIGRYIYKEFEYGGGHRDSEVSAERSRDSPAKVEGIVAVVQPGTMMALIVALVVVITAYTLELATTEGFNTYALSDFEQLSMASGLSVADDVITAVLKLPVAKLSDVTGKAEVYCVILVLYVLSCALRSGATSFGIFAAGSFLGIVAHAGTEILNLILISDLTSMRTRGLAANAFFVPMLATSWVAGIAIQRIIAGPGWRLGYGIFAVIMPTALLTLIFPLFILRREARRRGLLVLQKMRLTSFCSQVDLGGLALISGGIFLLLLPITIASKVTNDTLWLPSWTIIISMILGIVVLAGVVPYERYMALHPVVPVHYLSNRAIAASLSIGFCDSMSFAVTHVYLFPWAIAAHGFNARSALYLAQSTSVTQILTGLVVGGAIYRLRYYRQFAIAGGIFRFVGYALMISWRGIHSSTVEQFSTQIILGIGRGLIETTIFLSAQITVPQADLAQVTGLIAMTQHLGGAAGAAIAGSIYTRSMRERLRFRLRDDVNESFIDDVYASITGTLPEWGTPERVAVGRAYSDIMGYIATVALVLSVLVVASTLLMPDNRLTDGHSLVSGKDAVSRLNVQDVDELHSAS